MAKTSMDSGINANWSVQDGAGEETRPDLPSVILAPSSSHSAFVAFVERLEESFGGRIGCAALLLESGEAFQIRADEPFPMASCYKVAIAGTVLSMVDTGGISLEQIVPIGQYDVDHNGEAAHGLVHPGVALSVANLIEIMLTQSNNLATDKLIQIVGGMTAVTAWLEDLGIRGMRVDRNTSEIQAQFFGFAEGAPFYREFVSRWPTPDVQQQAELSRIPSVAFESDPRDTGTPAAMVELLVRIVAGSSLSGTSRRFLLGAMQRCESGQARLRGLLPRGTVVAHKTGTIGATVNDAGIIELPGGGGRIVVAVFIRGGSGNQVDRERAIAEISRSLFDYFAFR